MSRNVFGWDYPPGCTAADIDRHFGEPDPEPGEDEQEQPEEREPEPKEDA